MNIDQVSDIMRGALFVALQIAAPLLILSMVVGFMISVFQSVTQINEMTLTFVPKILVFAALLMAIFPWILKTMVKYTVNILVHQWDKILNATIYTT